MDDNKNVECISINIIRNNHDQNPNDQNNNHNNNNSSGVCDNRVNESININISNQDNPNHVKPKGFTIFGFPFSKIKWFNVFWFAFCHICAIIGFFYAIIYGIKALTITWAFLLGLGSGLGMSVGGHRLWAHRSFKPRWLLELFLIILQSISMNGSGLSYARDHRTHHKNSDTVADPKNSHRGFFFSQMGWQLLKKEPEVIREGKKLNYDDLYDNKLVSFQHEYYYLMAMLFGLVIPAVVPHLFWMENIYNSVLVCIFTRYIIVLHQFWTINSFAHLWGDRVYDKTMRPRENRFINYLSMGEGHHNFHHSFPTDYKGSKEGWLLSFDPTTLFIDVCCWINLAYDRKTTPPDIVMQRLQRTGCPEKVKQRSRLYNVINSLVDWLIGPIVLVWPLWLGLIIKIIYLAITSQVTLDNIIAGAF